MVSNIVLYAAAWLTTLRSTIIGSLRSERGQGILEYSVLVGAIVIVAGGALYVLNDGLDFDFLATTIQDCLDFNELGDCGG